MKFDHPKWKYHWNYKERNAGEQGIIYNFR